jgi:putative phosphoesterase
MLIGLVSDSHGELQNLKDAAWKLVYGWHVSLIVHLGDELEDLDAIKEMRVEMLSVPGVYCEAYRDSAVANRLIREFEGQRVLFTHTAQAHDNDLPGDPDPQQLAVSGQVDVVAFGHTHLPELRMEGGVLWVNPGHLKSEDKKGHAPSFVVLDLDRDNVRALLVDLSSGDIIDSCSRI